MDWDAAKRLVQAVEDAFGAADLATIEQGFAEDAVTRFADFPEMRGREAIMQRQCTVRAAAERRTPVAVHDQPRRRLVLHVEDGQSAVTPRAIGEVVHHDRVV